jgi:transposase
MSEKLFHNDETRWEVFVDIEGKVGTRWYLWVTRSKSVVFYCIDPSRSTAVPGAHFAGLQNDRVILVCDRYSAYKKLARLSDAILLAFCWAHVRRDFLNAANSFKTLEPWALHWKEWIGSLYHLNKRRLEYWEPSKPLTEQSAEFKQHHQALQELLQSMVNEAKEAVDKNKVGNLEAGRKEASRAGIKSSAEKQQVKVYQSLLNHWEGLTLFLNNPEVPLDNNIAENSIRNPVTGRKAYYGSGSIWSAELAATLFSILQTLALWNINPRHWLNAYFKACAKNKGKAPDNIRSFIPWEMNEARKDLLSRPEPP